MWKAMRANWIALASSILLLGAVFFILTRARDLDAVFDVWRRADKWAFSLAIVLTIVLVQSTGAWRLMTIMAADGVDNVGFRPLFRIQLISQFVAHGAPISAIADLARAAMVKLRFKLRSGRSVRIIVYERICGVLGAVASGIVASFILLAVSSETKIVDAQLLLWTGGLLGAGVLLAIGGLKVTTRFAFINRVAGAITALGLMLRRPRIAGELMLCSLAQICSFAAVYFVLAKGMDINVSWWLVLLFMPLIFFVSSLPIFYQGWGAREVIVIATIGRVGNVTSAESVALSVAFGTVVFLASLPGAVLWLMRPSMRKAVHIEIEQA
jgi:glycosyltransferase 2 family protein